MNKFRDKNTIQGLLFQIKKRASQLSTPLNIMEVCGTHTMTIHRYGLRNILAKNGINMLSGPGCPVCITPSGLHETAIELVTSKENLLFATFGDMTRVPTGNCSLQTAVPAQGSKIHIVYSPEESLQLAKQNPDKDVIFFGVGFETTIPSIALSIKTAHDNNLKNYSILSALWIIQPPLKALLEDRDTNIQGFLYPGHVSAIIGQSPYQFIAQEYKIPGAITGFEPVDILLGILSILKQLESGNPYVSNQYKRVVRPEGNKIAQKIMNSLLEKKDAIWRGLGEIPLSGLVPISAYDNFNTEIKYSLSINNNSMDKPGCSCGKVLKGIVSPPECLLFGEQCKPDSPYGPCMVSYEGACLAYYKYSLPSENRNSKE